MTRIVAHTYPEWWLKLTGQVAHWSTDYSTDFSPDIWYNICKGFNKMDTFSLQIF